MVIPFARLQVLYQNPLFSCPTKCLLGARGLAESMPTTCRYVNLSSASAISLRREIREASESVENIGVFEMDSTGHCGACLQLPFVPIISIPEVYPWPHMTHVPGNVAGSAIIYSFPCANLCLQAPYQPRVGSPGPHYSRFGPNI